MFKSQRRSIVVPQSEHLRLVGTLAMLWGNADFDFPPFERTSVTMGMGLHDRGYGLLDNYPIGSTAAEDWNRIARKSFYLSCADIVADTITKYHIRRLASHDESAERKSMTVEFSEAIDRQLSGYGLSRVLFDRIDRITELCDKISFDFCLDVPDSDEILIYPRLDSDQEILVRYQIADGLIRVAPWPFSAAGYKGYLMAYQSDGYPEKLDPFILPYRLEQNGLLE